MRIRKLELHGFKSFPDRTVLHFDPGISCIVGPNGCGKSNVMDALRWCIGEQSARSLRGSEMLDVIFAGAQDRKPVGFAEVQMTLTSEGGEPFPGEYAQMAEVSVGRRLHRTGASEYLINQRRVRRRDVVDLFLDTGIGNNLYSFIEQGRIGKIVHARPEERRSLIDEAAGISRYKVRRDEARERLAATSTQLDRAADVADEMARRVRSLSRQVKKAARFRRIRALVRQDEIALAMAKYGALAQDRRALRTQVRTLEGELGAATRGRARREADLEQRRAEVAVVEQGVETWRDEVAELDARARELSGAVGFTNQRLEELVAQQARDQASLDQVGVDLVAADNDEKRLTAEAAEAETRRQASAEVRSKAEADRDAAAEAVRLARQTAEQARTAAGAAELDRERLATEQAELDRRQERLPARGQQLAAALASVAESLTTGRQTIGAVEQQVEIAQADASAAEATWAELSDRVSSAQQESQSSLDRLGKAEAARDAHLEAETRQGGVLDAALAAANSAVEQRRTSADEAVEAAVAAADQGAADRRRAWRGSAQQALAGARNRAATWIAAVEAAQARADQTARADLDRAEKNARRQARERADALEERIEVELADALTAERQAVAARRTALEDELEQATDALAAADRQLVEARAVHREAGAELAGALARLEGLRAAVDAARSAGDGARILQETLGPTPTLAERLTPAARADRSVLARLGRRLALPVVADGETLAKLVAALPAGTSVEVLLRPAGPLDARAALGPIRPVDDLTAALAAHQQGLAAATQDGVNVGADGVILLGTSDDAGVRAAASVEAVGDGERAASAAELAHAEALRQVDGASDHRDQCDVRLGEVRDALDALRATLQGREDDLRDRHRLAAEQDREEQQQLTSTALADLAAQREERLQAYQRAGQAQLEHARSARETALAAFASAQQDGEAALEDQLAARREQAIAQARAEAHAAVGEAIEARDRARSAQLAWTAEASSRRSARNEPVQAARAQVAAARSHLDGLRTRLDAATEARNQANLTLAGARSELAAVRERNDRAAAEKSRLGEELEQLKGEEAGIAARRAEVSERWQAVNLRAAELREQALADAVALEQAEARSAEAAARLAELDVASATWTERAKASQAARDAVEARRAQLRQRQGELQQSLGAVAASDADLRAGLLAAEGELGTVQAQRAETWDRLERERVRLRELRDGVRLGEEDLRALGDSVGELTRSLDQVRARLDATREEIDGLRVRIEERYQQSVPGLLDRLDVQGSLVLDVDPAVAREVEVDGELIEAVQPAVLTSQDLSSEEIIAERVQAITDNRRALERLGEVNLAAFDEWAEVRARHEELELQRADLETSVARIRAAIAKMNRTCRQRFRDTFDLVNTHFQEMYPRLVGGGSARLSLTNEEDLLETGVDIFVQPPGKRLQNLTLLSGGEKAMTAIALILSLFKVKPSPFCVLDEVDAPLDEANGSRFNEALKEMSSASQFIVVTHNRKTMECASTLYGVTMPDPGCSRLVSVRLGE